MACSDARWVSPWQRDIWNSLGVAAGALPESSRLVGVRSPIWSVRSHNVCCLKKHWLSGSNLSKTLLLLVESRVSLVKSLLLLLLLLLLLVVIVVVVVVVLVIIIVGSVVSLDCNLLLLNLHLQALSRIIIYIYILYIYIILYYNIYNICICVKHMYKYYHLHRRKQ